METPVTETAAAPRATPGEAERSGRTALQRGPLGATLMRLGPFAIAIVVYATVFVAMRPPTTGDEPHYLLVAESIVFDGDLDLANDYASRSRTLRVYGGFPIDITGHAADYTDSGKLRPVHGVGLSAILAPAVAVGGLNGARLAMVLIASLLAYQLYRLLADLGLRRLERIGGWIAVMFCLPVLVFSNQVFPELPGALLIVIALRVMASREMSRATLALGATAGAALVWLNIRYFPLAIAVLLGLAYRGCSTGRDDKGLDVRDAGWSGAGERVRSLARRNAASVRRCWRTIGPPLLIPYVISFGSTAISFQYWYGSASPGAQYEPYWENTIGSGGWKFWFEYAVADVLDPTFGWIPFAPVHWIGLAALGCLVVRFGWPAIVAIGCAAGYVLVVESVGVPAGWGFPARFFLIVIPLVAVPLAVAIRHVGAARLLFLPLAAVSFLFAFAAAKHPEALYPLDAPRLFGVRSIAPAFPRPRAYPDAFMLYPGQFRPHAGEIRDGAVVASAPHHPPGFVLWGPNAPLKAGTYRAEFLLAASPAGLTGPVATIDIIGTPSDTLLAQRSFSAGQLRRRPFSRVDVDFATPGSFLVQTRVYYHGRGRLAAGPVRVSPVPPTVRPADFRDWPLAFLWFAGTVLVGALFVQTMDRRRAPAKRGP